MLLNGRYLVLPVKISVPSVKKKGPRGEERHKDCILLAECKPCAFVREVTGKGFLSNVIWRWYHRKYMRSEMSAVNHILGVAVSENLFSVSFILRRDLNCILPTPPCLSVRSNLH